MGLPRSDKDAARWLPAARAGSPEALGQVLEACRGYLLLIAQQELDPDLRAKGGASDLVQETVLHALRGFDGFRGQTEAELLAWLRQQLLHNLADFTRCYRGTAKRQVGREIVLSGGGPGANIASPSGQAIAHEQAAAVQQILAQLPDDYRRVLVLRYQEQQSFEEIGRLLGRSANAARKLWRRALEQMQRELSAPP
jgi:RNA polymerase sigma-70 factor (ECF subfamily)